jgi:hypothetical protein
MRLGCSGCLGALIALAVIALLVGGTLGATVRMLADPDVTVPATSAADGTRAQRKLFSLARESRRVQTVVLTESELNALLARHLVQARGIRLATPSVQLIGGDRFVLRAQSPLRQLFEEASLAAVADVMPSRWQTRPVWLRVGARVRLEEGPRRQLRVDVDEFAVGRQRLPAPAVRLLLEPASVGLLQWPLPEHVEHVAIEPDRVVIQTGPSR